MNKDKNQQRGTIVCTRVVSYDEVSPFLKTHSIDEAVELILKSEQNEWKKTNSVMILSEDKKTQRPNPDFFKKCFPKWHFMLNGKRYSPAEAVASGIVGTTTWDVELKVEHDSKLEAYKLLQNKKSK